MKRLLILTAIWLAAGMAAHAQFQIGLEGGLNINRLHASASALDDVLSKSNRMGFFVGPKVMYNSPIGLGADAALLYSSKSNTLDSDNSKYLNYLEIPVNLRYRISLLKLASVYVAAGPQWSHFVGKKDWSWNVFTQEFRSTVKENTVSVNLGAGVQFLSHYQLGFNYNIPVTENGNLLYESVKETNWRNNTWQVRLNYFF